MMPRFLLADRNSRISRLRRSIISRSARSSTTSALWSPTESTSSSTFLSREKARTTDFPFLEGGVVFPPARSRRVIRTKSRIPSPRAMKREVVVFRRLPWKQTATRQLPPIRQMSVLRRIAPVPVTTQEANALSPLSPLACSACCAGDPADSLYPPPPPVSCAPAAQSPFKPFPRMG